jgi:hypothetical protein
MTNEQIIEKTKTSPALKNQAKYPVRWNGKVPLKIKCLKTVHPEPFFMHHKDGTLCESTKEYYVWVNSYGAVSAILKNGEQLGLKPDEFEVTEWHKPIN